MQHILTVRNRLCYLCKLKKSYSMMQLILTVRNRFSTSYSMAYKWIFYVPDCILSGRQQDSLRCKEMNSCVLYKHSELDMAIFLGYWTSNMYEIWRDSTTFIRPADAKSEYPGITGLILWLSVPWVLLHCLAISTHIIDSANKHALYFDTEGFQLPTKSNCRGTVANAILFHNS